MVEPKIITLYCHKGGVSKTTTCFHLGWKLAEKGRRVILVDADPQCNLTGLMMKFAGIEEMRAFYEKKGNTDIYSGLKEVFESGEAISEKPFQTTKLKEGGSAPTNLFLVAGNLDFACAEPSIQMGLRAWQGMPIYARFPGLYPKLIRDLARNEGADYVLIDTAPSISAINECLVMGSDYFLVPTMPDYFCVQAIQSMAGFIPRWDDDTEPFRNGQTNQAMSIYRFPRHKPKFLGYIVQNYRIYRGKESHGFHLNMKDIQKAVRNEFAPALQKRDMCISGSDYKLAEFSNFNTLIATSQQEAIPVFALQDKHLGQGQVLQTQKANVRKFNKAFADLALAIEERCA